MWGQNIFSFISHAGPEKNVIAPLRMKTAPPRETFFLLSDPPDQKNVLRFRESKLQEIIESLIFSLPLCQNSKVTHCFISIPVFVSDSVNLEITGNAMTPIAFIVF